MVRSYETSSGRTRWQAVWNDIDGKQRSKNFDDEGSATAYAQRMVLERDASLPPLICAREGCDEIVPRHTAKGHKQRLYHSDECERLVANSTAARSKRRARAAAVPALPAPKPCANPDCDEVVPYERGGEHRKFHDDACRVAYWNKHDRPEPKRHVISAVNEDARTGYCSQHEARVPVWRVEDKYADGRPRLRWICSLQRRESDTGSRRRYQCSEKGRLTKMACRYGVTREELAAALTLKTDHCDSCGTHTDECGELVYEHDHDDGHHRGWTCHDCNLMIGNAKHNPARLRAGAAYLERTRRTE